MDNRLGEMETFLAVARQGSLAGAARELRLRRLPSAGRWGALRRGWAYN
jgi:hypothetical protein